MTTSLSAAQLYKLTVVFGAMGAVVYLWFGGVRESLAFAAGAVCSIGNLWLFDWLSRTIAPGDGSAVKPWRGGAFISRYILLLGFGYAIVKALGVSPLAVILGLLASAAAVLTAGIFEIASQPFKARAHTK